MRRAASILMLTSAPSREPGKLHSLGMDMNFTVGLPSMGEGNKALLTVTGKFVIFYRKSGVHCDDGSNKRLFKILSIAADIVKNISVLIQNDENLYWATDYIIRYPPTPPIVSSSDYVEHNWTAAFDPDPAGM